MALYLDTPVVRINGDGTTSLTNVVNVGDTILHTTYAELAARNTVPTNQAQGWVRTDVTAGQIDAHGGYPNVLMERYHTAEDEKPTVTVLPEEGTVTSDNARPADEAPKREWWVYAVAQGYDESDYDHVSKSSLISWTPNA